MKACLNENLVRLKQATSHGSFPFSIFLNAQLDKFQNEFRNSINKRLLGHQEKLNRFYKALSFQWCDLPSSSEQIKQVIHIQMNRSRLNNQLQAHVTSMNQLRSVRTPQTPPSLRFQSRPPCCTEMWTLSISRFTVLESNSISIDSMITHSPKSGISAKALGSSKWGLYVLWLSSVQSGWIFQVDLL